MCIANAEVGSTQLSTTVRLITRNKDPSRPPKAKECLDNVYKITDLSGLHCPS